MDRRRNTNLLFLGARIWNNPCLVKVIFSLEHDSLICKVIFSSSNYLFKSDFFQLQQVQQQLLQGCSDHKVSHQKYLLRVYLETDAIIHIYKWHSYSFWFALIFALFVPSCYHISMFRMSIQMPSSCPHFAFIISMQNEGKRRAFELTCETCKYGNRRAQRGQK